MNEERSAIVPRASRPGSRSRPYRSFFVWHVGNEDVVGDANPALFITGGEEYRMSHPVRGGYAELADATREDCAPTRRSGGAADVWTCACSAFGRVFSPGQMDRRLTPSARSTRRLLVRTKAYLESQLAQPIHLADVGRAVGASPAYLTYLFRQVEGVPLHRYLTQLRLVRALVELPHTDDLTALALDSGFSSHSHFSASFHRAFRMTPTEFRRLSRGRVRPSVI